ncbi:hypothetical protein CEXT_278911 [Caerostris extrusa]|uniref:Uncharacterized protein n=1 Tax=Caerostris extrusa TaxID=172846 RepID=A0AAV4RIE6_CAEEX|nr:hypothetical protein CEXT_278911 [Caerostris extrusa]
MEKTENPLSISSQLDETAFYSSTFFEDVNSMITTKMEQNSGSDSSSDTSYESSLYSPASCDDTWSKSISNIFSDGWKVEC